MSFLKAQIATKTEALAEQARIKAEQVAERKAKAAEYIANGGIDWYGYAKEHVVIEELLTECGYENIGNGSANHSTASNRGGLKYYENGRYSCYSGTLLEAGLPENGDVSDLIKHHLFEGEMTQADLVDYLTDTTEKERQIEYAQTKSIETAFDGFDFKAISGNKVADISQAFVSKKRGFTLVPASQLTSKPRPNDWLIKDIIESNNYGMIFGEPESGKSLLTLDMAFCISNGLPWNGHPTKQGNVAYVAGEGHTGLGRRVKALELMYNTKTDNLFFSEMPASLTDEHSVKDVANTIKAVCADPVLIVVDTLHRNFGSGDENSAGDFGTATNHIDTHLRNTGAAVILVHHSGHGAKDRSRGSSSIKAALDVEYNVTKNQENIVSMVCTKSKDFNKPKPQNFEINEVDLGWKDEDGQPIKSINLEGYEGHVSRGKIKELSHRNKQILATLTEAVEAFGEEPNNAIRRKYTCYKHDKVVSTDNWRKIAYRIIDAETTNAKKSAFNRACAILQKSKDIQLYDGYYWIGTKALLSDPDTANNSMWASSINHASYI